MSARALAAVAVITAALASRAAALPVPGQAAPPPAAPASTGYARVGGAPVVEPVLVPAEPAGLNGGLLMPVGLPAVMPAQGMVPGQPPPGVPPGGPAGPAMPPGMPGGPVAGPPLPTDDLIGGPGLTRGLNCWVGAEYLLYWTKDAPLSVPIVTGGPATSTGIIGQPGVTVALGNTSFDFKNFSGVRVLGGAWLTQNQSLGVEGNIFILPSKRVGMPQITGVPGQATLARPFYDTALNRQSSRVLTRPGTFSGGINLDTSSQLWGAEVGPVWRYFDRGGHVTMDFVTGFKFLSLEESLTVNDFAAAVGTGQANFNGQTFRQPAVTFVNDHYATDNRFFGGVIGNRTNLHYQAFTLSLVTKLGLGNMQEAVRVDGTSSLVGVYPVPQVAGGGFFSQGGNSGKFVRNEFAVIPELNLNLAVQLTSHLTATFGYNYLYVSRVVRPGDQLGTNLNNTLIPTGQNFGARFGPQGPGVPFNSSNYWAQGFNLGLSVGY